MESGSLRDPPVLAEARGMAGGCSLGPNAFLFSLSLEPEAPHPSFEKAAGPSYFESMGSLCPPPSFGERTCGNGEQVWTGGRGH